MSNERFAATSLVARSAGACRGTAILGDDRLEVPQLFLCTPCKAKAALTEQPTC